MPRAKPPGDVETKEEAQAFVENLGEEVGEGQQVAESPLDDSTRGDPRCPSDWEVWDCFWCAASNCVNPRWPVFVCVSCHFPNTK
jgi:hypothetical protein